MSPLKEQAASPTPGASRFALGDYAGAIEECDQALRLDPRHAQAYNNRAAARHALRDFAGAIADCDQALALDPRYARAYNIMRRGPARPGRLCRGDGGL